MSAEVSNPDYREQQLQKARGEIKQEKVDRLENHATKQWLQERKTFETVRVDGRPFEFEEVNTETALEALELAGDGEELQLSEMPDLLWRVSEILADHIQDEYLGDTTETVHKGRETTHGAVRWVQNFKPAVLEMVFEDLTSSGMSSEEIERAEKFLEE